MLALLLALLTAGAVAGALLGIRMIRADAKLPSDLALALEVGGTRVSTAESAVDRLGMRFAPTVLRLMGPAVSRPNAAASTWRAIPAA